MRIDRAVSRGLAYYLSSVSKKTFGVTEFSPFDKAIEEAREGTVDEAFDMFRSLAKHGNEIPRDAHARSGR